MTGQALEVMGRCQVIAGYTVYVDLVRDCSPEGVSDHCHDQGRGTVP